MHSKQQVTRLSGFFRVNGLHDAQAEFVALNTIFSANFPRDHVVPLFCCSTLPQICELFQMGFF